MRGFYDGPDTFANVQYVGLCSHVFTLATDLEATILFTRDIGHHSGGWWKNPDYERCWHLSLGFRNPLHCEHLPHDRPQSDRIARMFFGDDAVKCWIEAPYSEEGKRCDIWHYRLFCDEAWQPISPRGEVYSREHTPPDWQSFSQIHGYKPDPAQAPFLLDARK
jgi:hypothetical protein